MFSEGGNEGWERFRKRQGKTLRKILSKARELEKNKSNQIKKFGNVEVDEGMGAAYMPRAGTQGVPEREITSKAVKKQLNRNRNKATMKGNVETPKIRYTHSRDKSTDYISPQKKRGHWHKKKKRRVGKANESVQPTGKATKAYSSHGISKDATKSELKAIRSNPESSKGKKQLAHWRLNMHKANEAVNAKDLPGLKKLSKQLKGSVKAHQDQKKALDKLMVDEGSKPNNPKLWAAKKAAAKSKFDVYPSAYANGWAAKQYKAAGGTWRSESVEYPERETLKQKQDKKTTSTLAAHQKRMLDSARKSIAKNDKNEGTYANFSKRRGAQLTPKEKEKANAMYKQKARDDIKRKMAKAYGIKNETFGSNGLTLSELGDPNKMNQLFRMGLAKKGELNLMQRMMKRGPDALKDPKLRQKMYDLLVDLTDIVTKDGQTFVKVRQHVQKNKKELQAVEELLHYGGRRMLKINESFGLINITEDMSGMSVSSGHKRSKDSGAGMTKKGVNAYRRRNPGSKLQTAVTTPPSKLKAGSKAAGRRKSFCARSRSWTGERGKAARKRWNC